MDIRDRLSRVLSPGVLAGVRVRDWLALLHDNSYDVDAACLPRAAVITMCALWNSAVRCYEEPRHRRAVEGAEIQPPVFILGLARSGTTLLHELFAVDNRFAVPTLYEVRFPHTFLCTERLVSRLTAPLLPAQRSQDNVRFGWQRPGEEGAAVALLSRCASEFGTVFPRRRDHYSRYYTLENVSAAELERWRAAMLHFLRKLTVRHGPKPFVLKTPVNVARVGLLAELFPDARFVYIHRNPYDVARSQLGMRATVPLHRRLQRVDDTDAGAFIEHLGRIMDRALSEMRELRAEQVTEIRFADLAADSVATMHAVYTALALPPFEAVEPALRQRAESGREYRRNVHPELPGDLRERVARAWRPLFESGGYEI